MAVVAACDEDRTALLKQRNKIKPGDRLELLLPGTCGIPFTAEKLWDESGEQIADTRHAEMLFRMQLPEAAPPYTLIRTARNTGG